MCLCVCAGIGSALIDKEPCVCVCCYRLCIESHWAMYVFVCAVIGYALSPIEACMCLCVLIYVVHWVTVSQVCVCVCAITDCALSHSEACVCLCVCVFVHVCIYVCCLYFPSLIVHFMSPETLFYSQCYSTPGS